MNKLALKFSLAVALLSAPTAVLAWTPAAADAPGKTSAGVAYTQPKDWEMSVQGAMTVFTAPEADLRIAVIDAGAAADAKAAVAKAWSVYKPNAAARVLRLATPGTPGDGWDQRVSFSYETAPGERAVASAQAMRKGTAWTVVIVDGADATMNKRAAAAAIIERSLRPAGYAPETFAGKTAHRLTPERIAALREFIAQSAKELEVPGVGIAIIDQGKVVWQGGYGVRELGHAEPVDAHTKFMIASNTKGMSTLLLSVLADEGKLRWDQKVVDLYPSFRLGSDATTKAVEVRHLVCACTGLPRRDYAFILADGKAPATDTFSQLSKTEPTSAFGELYQYSNLLAAAAGYLGGTLAYPNMEIGAAYDKAMQTRIFGPLGMHDTTFDFKVGESGDWARPHGYDIDGQMTEMSNHFNHLIVPYRPAGGAWSSAADVARYAELELSKGLLPDGKRLVSQANLLERRKRGVPTGEGAWYGMGLFNEVVSGVPVITHGGTLQGFHSDWWILPDSGMGAVLLTNADTGPAMFGPFLRRLLEVAYDGKPEAAQEVANAATRLKAQAKAKRARLTIPGDPAALANLAPRYREPEFGNVITIENRNGGKWVEAGAIEGPVATRKNTDGSLSLVSIAPGNIGLDATIGNRNGARTLTVRDSQHEYVYTEVR
ncbi:MAG TPA: serine hydrolase domain-containing protein [Phenylobacterium sp.]|jgi:CubicO group peptidase (beta-lactamase class C family)|uniref:serine hydrolase domain-containing protein n=1 Tax=Phenylobacterium sp. TaxID=1871053 RepID=UPI002D378798|nr:serine hydrolase domain-containing protein [Phenylobacterium sp.]HZZ70182.1 serine hydrolase domain-containing protein [Phenylobacterium sp.]